jgi:hypothetical protein
MEFVLVMIASYFFRSAAVNYGPRFAELGAVWEQRIGANASPRIAQPDAARAKF